MPSARHRRRRRPPRRRHWAFLAVGLGTTCGLVAVLVTFVPGGRPPAAGPGAEARLVSDVEPSAPAVTSWRGVIDELDRERTRAWRTGDTKSLGQVYVAGSRVLRNDQRNLAAYVRRGLTVEHARMQFSAVEALRVGDRSVRLRVVDQLRRSVVRDQYGRARALPRDRPTEHLIVLRLVGDQWLIARVSAAAPP